MNDKTAVGLLLLRLFLGIRIIYGVMDNLFSWEHMQEFAGFLASFHFPVPIVSAVTSVLIQSICGLLILIGWQTRWAAGLLAVNFIVALTMVHFRNGDTIEAMTPALAILFISAALAFTGPGRYAVDKM